MPIYDGFETIQIIKKIYAEKKIELLPIFVLHTIFEKDRDFVKKAKRLGVEDFVQKPLS